ncbi:MAG: sensor [Cyclobacteriaceae bacterium]|nr:MAG: sensor [Cyclobacteriaceae bacterium]
MEKKDLLRKWLADQLTEEELEVFKRSEDYHINMEVIRYASKFKAPEFSPSKSISTLLERPKDYAAKPRKLWPHRLLRIAAALLLGLVVYYFYPTDNLVSISTSIREKTTIELPDASVVQINAGSEVSYNKNTWKLRKRVQLKGEAYFEVVKGGRFNVITPDGVVSVLGTKFNVKQRSQFFEVQCFEGVVKVTSKQFEEELRAGDNLIAIDGQLTLGTNTSQEPQWPSNISAFQNTPLYEVFAEFERQYGVMIVVNGVDTQRLFTGGFDHQHLENALVAITEPLQLLYRLDSRDQVTITPQ